MCCAGMMRCDAMMRDAMLCEVMVWRAGVGVAGCGTGDESMRTVRWRYDMMCDVMA